IRTCRDTRGLPSFPTRRSSDLTRHEAAKSNRYLCHAPKSSSKYGWARGWRPSTPTLSLGRERLLRVDSLSTKPRPVTLPRSVCRSEEHTSELQSRENLVCRLLL